MPLRLDASPLDPILDPSQAVAVGDGTDPYAALWPALDRISLNAQDSFDWPTTEVPYPGFEAFDERHAGVYFGRESEIYDILDRLTRQRGPGNPKLLLVTGPSGAGKSSLIRAGVLPRLKKSRERWLVLEPFRPSVDPLGDLARTFVHGFGRCGETRDVAAVEAPAFSTIDARPCGSHAISPLRRGPPTPRSSSPSISSRTSFKRRARPSTSSPPSWPLSRARRAAA